MTYGVPYFLNWSYPPSKRKRQTSLLEGHLPYARRLGVERRETRIHGYFKVLVSKKLTYPLLRHFWVDNFASPQVGDMLVLRRVHIWVAPTLSVFSPLRRWDPTACEIAVGSRSRMEGDPVVQCDFHLVKGSRPWSSWWLQKINIWHKIFCSLWDSMG